MKVLIYGAGVIGSIYAARLHGPNHEVYLLARGERLADLQQHGLILQHAITSEKTFLRVPLVTEMTPEDAYDLAIVAVRLNQLATVLPDLAANRHVQNVLFMVNNVAGYEEWLDAVGVERILVGFPGFAGDVIGPVVKYVDLPVFLQKTTIGEPDGSITPRLLMVRISCAARGFGSPFAATWTPGRKLMLQSWLRSPQAYAQPRTPQTRWHTARRRSG